jgi:hypothetical protein
MRLMRNVIAAATIFVVASPASSANSAAAFRPRAEQLLRPYVDTNNFSGVVLAARGGKPVFYRAYGFADFGKHIPNGMRTRFTSHRCRCNLRRRRPFAWSWPGDCPWTLRSRATRPQFPTRGEKPAGTFFHKTRGIGTENV